MSARDDIEEMIKMRQEGFSLQVIGDHLGISRERVRQLIGNTGQVASEAQQIERRARIAAMMPEIHEAMMAGEATSSIRKRFGLSRREYSQASRDAGGLVRSIRLSRRTKRDSHYSLPDLQRAAQILGKTPGTKAYEELRLTGQLPAGAVSAQMIARQYGAWSTACEEAGLVPNPRHPDPRFGGRHYTDEEILRSLLQWKQTHGDWPTSESWDGQPTANGIRARFGLWTTALQEAAALEEAA